MGLLLINHDALLCKIFQLSHLRSFTFPKFEERLGTTEAGLPLDKQYLYIPEECICSGLYTPGLREVQGSFK